MNILNYITEAKIDASWLFNSEKTGSKKMTEKVNSNDVYSRIDYYREM